MRKPDKIKERTSFLSLAAVSLVAVMAAAPAKAADADALANKLNALSAQVQAMQKEITDLKAQNEALAAQQEGKSSGSAAASDSAQGGHAGAAATADNDSRQLSIYGYGEINYNHYDDDSRTQADLRRAVFGFGYRFNPDTHFVSEFEFEHGVVSADDSGEAEVEQFYIDHRLGDFANLKAGLFLIPSGLLNTSHEPTRYYGVERNQVETAIIPSTWREGGLGLYGSSDAGLSWDIGVTTGMKLANWDFTSTEGRESPFGAIHQELQLASSSDLSQYIALDYAGVQGLRVGASVFTGEIDQSQPGIDGSPRSTIWEGHARYLHGPLDLSAIYAKGHISDTAALNLANTGQPGPIPKDFYGWYLQGAYNVWKHGSYALTPFLRYERYNTGSAFAAQPPGLGNAAYPLETVQTIGLSFFLDPNVVIKADYQNFDQDNASDRFDLGFGLMF